MSGTAADSTTAASVLLPGCLVLISPLAQLIYIPVSIVVGDSLGLTAPQIGITVGAHSAAAGVGMLAFGPLLDVVPVRKVLPVALVANLAISLALWWRQSYQLLLIGRIGTGVIAAIILLSAYVLVSDSSKGNAGVRNRGFSSMQTFQSVGAASGLGIGALFAGLGRPIDVFGLLAIYSLLVVVVAVRWLPSGLAIGADSRRLSFSETLSGIRRLSSSPRVLWMMIGSAALGLVIQGSHFGVSQLLEVSEVSVPLRVLTSMLIPLGVFSGSSLNRGLLGRRTSAVLYPRVYSGLAVAAGLYALLVAVEAATPATAASLWLLGALLGSAMPLSVALVVGWHQEVRGTATSVEALARQMGSTVGPILVGIVVAAFSSAAAALVVALVATLGFIAAWAATRIKTSHRR